MNLTTRGAIFHLNGNSKAYRMTGRSIAHHLPGGQPPELPLAWSPSVKGTSRVISSPISAKPGARYGGLVMVRVEDRMVFESMLRPNIQQAGMPAFLKTEMPILPVSNKQEMATLSAVFILLLPMAVQPVEAGKKYLPPG